MGHPEVEAADLRLIEALAAERAAMAAAREAEEAGVELPALRLRCALAHHEVARATTGYTRAICRAYLTETGRAAA
jgi:hypothetical protein